MLVLELDLWWEQIQEELETTAYKIEIVKLNPSRLDPFVGSIRGMTEYRIGKEKGYTCICLSLSFIFANAGRTGNWRLQSRYGKVESVGIRSIRGIQIEVYAEAYELLDG